MLKVLKPLFPLLPSTKDCPSNLRKLLFWTNIFSFSSKGRYTILIFLANLILYFSVVCCCFRSFLLKFCFTANVCPCSWNLHLDKYCSNWYFDIFSTHLSENRSDAKILFLSSLFLSFFLFGCLLVFSFLLVLSICNLSVLHIFLPCSLLAGPKQSRTAQKLTR